jgi:hypothetical protein
MSTRRTLIPIYTTRGDLGAFLIYPYLYNYQGEWIGWVTPDRRVYSVHGQYVGWLSEDPRILRKRSETEAYEEARHTIPAPPPPIHPPSRVALPKMMPELPYGVLDVLEERPELLPSPDFGELRQDMD